MGITSVHTHWMCERTPALSFCQVQPTWKKHQQAPMILNPPPLSLCVCTCMHVHMCVNVWVEARGQPWVLFLESTLFETGSLKSQGSACLYSLSATTPGLLLGSLGWGHDCHLADCIISLVPDFTFWCWEWNPSFKREKQVLWLG